MTRENWLQKLPGAQLSLFCDSVGLKINEILVEGAPFDNPHNIPTLTHSKIDFKTLQQEHSIKLAVKCLQNFFWPYMDIHSLRYKLLVSTVNLYCKLGLLSNFETTCQILFSCPVILCSHYFPHLSQCTVMREDALTLCTDTCTNWHPFYSAAWYNSYIAL